MKLPLGLYDLLVSESLAAELPSSESPDYELLKKSLDSGDSHVAFVRHLRDLCSELSSRSLRSTGCAV